MSTAHSAKVTRYRHSTESDHRLRVRRSHAELEPVQTASCPQEALAVGHYSMSAEWRSGADRKLWRLGTGRVPFSSAVSQCPGHDSNALVRHALERGVRRASCGRWGRNRELVDRIQRCVPDQRLALRQLSDDLPIGFLRKSLERDGAQIAL